MTSNVVELPKKLSHVQKQISDINDHMKNTTIDCLMAAWTFTGEDGLTYFAFSYSDKSIQDQNWLLDKFKQDLLEE